MKIKSKDIEYAYTHLKFDEGENAFILSDGQEHELLFSTDLHLDTEYDPNNFKLYYYYNKNCSENSIFQVYIKSDENKEIRIGWIFPISSLLSDQHDEAQNKYFQKYAYVALYNILNELDIVSNEIYSNIIYEALSSDDRIIFVMDKENIVNIVNFEISDYQIGFYKYGFYESDKGIRNSNFDKPRKKLHLKKFSNALIDKNSKLIILSILEQITSCSSEILVFYFCYQIIEFLINKVFDNEFTTVVKKVTDSVENLFDIKDEFNDLMNEKKRVRKLFNDYSNINSNSRNSLNELCKNLLRDNEHRNYNDLGDNIYAVRCLLVHKLYSIQNIEQELVDIDYRFFECIIEILETFKLNIDYK